jgi:hypothetical protein
MPPRQPRSAFATALLLIFGLLLLAPGVCSIISIGAYITSPSLQNPGTTVLGVILWLICFLISAGGIWLIGYASRR